MKILLRDILGLFLSEANNYYLLEAFLWSSLSESVFWMKILEGVAVRSGSLRLNNLFEYISDKFSRNFKLIFSRSLFRSIDCQYPISLIRCLII